MVAKTSRPEAYEPTNITRHHAAPAHGFLRSLRDAMFARDRSVRHVGECVDMDFVASLRVVSITESGSSADTSP